MSREVINGVWVVICDWVDPDTKELCSLGVEGAPAMFVDPSGGRDQTTHFQCGRHHGIIPQAERPEFQLPPGHKLNEDIITNEEEKIRGGQK